jgi:uncharacterized protein (TIGR03437 family)
VTARVDTLALHFYGSCGRDQSTDDQVFGDLAFFTTGTGTPGGSATIPSTRTLMQTNPALANVPIWITEANVDADFSNNGTSACHPGSAYDPDPRANSAFYAAFFPLAFERFAQDGVQGMNHWNYPADNTFGEVDQTSGAAYLSYWVDYWLAHLFPSPPGANILQLTSSDTTGNTDAFAAKNPDGSVVVMLIDHQVASSTDNNGSGVANSFDVDLSALGSFTSVTHVQIDATTDPSAGPQIQTVAFQPNMQLSIPGYGVAFLKLNQAIPAIADGGIVNAASYADGPVAPGELVTIFGAAMGPPQPVNGQLNVPGFFANSLVGTRVLFDGVPAPLIYASASQTAAIVPYGVAGHNSTQVQLEYLGSVSAPVTMPVAATAPGLFTVPPIGKGTAAVLDLQYQLVTDSNPVSAGDYVIIYLVGSGAADPDELDGMVAVGAASTNTPVTVTIGGVDANPAYAGRAPGEVFGVMQINAQVPQGVDTGDQPIQVTIGGVSSQGGVTIAVK